MNTRISPFFLLFIFLSFPLFAKFELGMPVKCTVGKDCFIQNYVDVHRESDKKKPRDYKCGSLVYHGHKGTDFRVPTYKSLKRGVEVIAVADGTIKAIRTDMPESDKYNAPDIKGRECGNGVVIEHGDGWETQYCHMRQNSIKIKVGDKVKKGDKLGLMGISGKTQFPHLHLSIRKNGKVVDPFIGPVNKTTKCGGPLNSLWTKDAEKQVLPYQATALIASSFSGEIPSQKTVMQGEHDHSSLPSTIDKLIFWVYLAGVRAGDEESFKIIDPTGRTLFKKRMKSVKKHKATWLSFIGKKVKIKNKKENKTEEKPKKDLYQTVKKFLGFGDLKKRGFLSEGIYKATYQLIRPDKNGKDQIIIELNRDVEIKF